MSSLTSVLVFFFMEKTQIRDIEDDFNKPHSHQEKFWNSNRENRARKIIEKYQHLMSKSELPFLIPI